MPDDSPDSLAVFKMFYIPDSHKLEDPYVSPMLANDFSDLPKAVIATAEYDGLRQQGKFYAGQLAKANVPVKVLRYCGCFHSFFERLGYLPQSEDLCREMAKELMTL